MGNAFEMAASQPWLILPNALADLLSVSERMGNPVALEQRLGRPLDNARTVSVRGGVATIPIIGPIFRYANLFTEISGATSTQVLATDIRQALDNPSVKAIVLNIDSPGGVASGINELADLIYAGRSQKRIVAYVGGTGASAAYWIASAAHEIVVDETAMLGSIGVVLEVTVDTSQAGRAQRYQIVSRNAPNKRPDLGTDAGRAKVGEMVDALAQVFEQKVARNLNVKRDRVQAMGDSGGIRVGAEAVKSGLAKRIGSLESVTASLISSSNESNPKPKSPSAASPNVSSKPTPRVTATVQTDEQKRVAGIMALSQPGMEGEALKAISDGLSVEEAGHRFFKAWKSGVEAIAASTKTKVPAPAQRPQQFSTGAIWRARNSTR